MSYTPPKYPSEIPDLTDLPDYTDDIDWMRAEYFNAFKKEIRAIMIELGTNPKGAYASVSARLDALEGI